MFPFRNKKAKEGRALYRQAVDQARQPGFYAGFGVPDTLDGRFEMISLHAFLILRRLNDKKLGQALFDAMFVDMDRALREMGVGDLGVPRKVKGMMKAFNGRAHAYAAALESGQGLDEAVRRNIYGTISGADPAAVAAMTAYIRAAAAMAEGFPEVEHEKQAKQQKRA